jgi:hypothetical protein
MAIGLILDLDFTRAAIEAFDSARRCSRREPWLSVKPERKYRVRVFPKRRVEGLSLLSRYAKHPAPETKAAFADENVRLQHSKVRFVEGRGYESLETCSIPKLKQCPHEEHAIGLAHRQCAGKGSKGLFVGFVVPGLSIIGPVAANPYGMPVEVCWREFAELLQLWHGRLSALAPLLFDGQIYFFAFSPSCERCWPSSFRPECFQRRKSAARLS